MSEKAAKLKKRILKALKETSWSKLMVEVNDHGHIIKDAFSYEEDFLKYINDVLEKYKFNYLDFELVKDENNEPVLLFRLVLSSHTTFLSKEYLQELGDDIKLHIKDEEIEDIIKTESNIREKFMKVLTIDTDEVEPMYFPLNEKHFYLREDDEIKQVDHEKVLQNAPEVDSTGEYITIVKVVK